MKENKKILIIISSIVLLLIGFVGAAKIYKSEKAQAYSFMAKEDFKKFVPDYAVRKGNPEAQVFVTEFFDPECESCREFHPLMESLMEEYKDKIQLILRYAPFHGNSIFAIKILEASRKQNKYWETLNVLYKYQPLWGNHHAPRPELIWTYLPEAGVDLEQIRKDMEDPQIQELIKKELESLSQLQIRGTPTFFVNGRPLDNFGFDYLKNGIDEALREE